MTVGANMFPKRSNQQAAPSDAPIPGFRRLPQDVASKLHGWGEQELFDFTRPMRATNRFRRAQQWTSTLATFALGLAAGVAAGHWLPPWTWSAVAGVLFVAFVAVQLTIMKRKLEMIEAAREGERGIVDLGPEATTPEKGIELAARRVNAAKADEFAARVAEEKKEQVA